MKQVYTMTHGQKKTSNYVFLLFMTSAVFLITQIILVVFHPQCVLKTNFEAEDGNVRLDVTCTV
jgi:hypothetical protein